MRDDVRIGLSTIPGFYTDKCPTAYCRKEPCTLIKLCVQALTATTGKYNKRCRTARKNNISMVNRFGICLLMVFTLVLAAACTTPQEKVQPADDATDCHIIYDAGSSATRLFIYQETASGWLKHKGPETDPLSDPIRRNRGKSLSDVNARDCRYAHCTG